MLFGKELEKLQNVIWNNKWLETGKTNEHMKYIQIFPEKANHDPMPEMVHFLTRHEPFAVKMAQMNSRESDK